MISCTEFIPAYSELFAFLEERNGPQEVRRFWKYLFQPGEDGLPLSKHLKASGLRGCFTYWSASLSEEAADFTLYLNEKAGWFWLQMHRCPSKGRLLELQQQIGLKPYRDYCLHCDNYRLAIEEAGLREVYNFMGTDRASCSILVYDPKIFADQVVVDENTEILDRRASDNEYFHQEFHHCMNQGIHYLAEQFGDGAVGDYFVRFTENVYGAAREAIKTQGLPAVADMIRKTYEKEKCPDALTLTENADSLLVEIAYCPAVRYLRSVGHSVSPKFRASTEVVMQTLAKQGGLQFTMEAYDEETGAARYRFDRV